MIAVDFKSKKLEINRLNNVYCITMTDGDNRFTPDMINEWHKALDLLEKIEESIVLVTFSKDSKIYSNGLSTDHIAELGFPYVNSLAKLCFRLQCLKFVTIACVNGHAFAGGCIFAIAHDYRIMRKERGFLCMNEIDIGLPMPEYFYKLVFMPKVNNSVFMDLCAIGKRFTAQDALTSQLVQYVVEGDKINEFSIKFAQSFEKRNLSSDGIKQMKELLYQNEYRVLQELLDLEKKDLIQKHPSPKI